jgi:ABC-2 type transport system ATP-binding protein
MSSIRIQGLTKTYGPVRALDGLDLVVEPGTVFGFLGPNGAGKTTTIRILAGLARPDGGQAFVAGEPVGPEGRARAKVGYLPEEPHFYPWMRAEEFLASYVGGLFGLPRHEARARAGELLERVGLSEAGRRRIAGFSRGMRQRLGLAQALMNQPQVLLLDEPVSALDPGGRKEILELIGGLNEQATVFMSTHILADVDRICDTIGVIDHGRLVARETRDALLDRYAIPAVEVEFEEGPEAVTRWAEAMERLPAAAAVEVDGRKVRVHLAGSAGAAAEVQRRALGSSLTILEYRIARPSLEDVFLRLVEK